MQVHCDGLSGYSRREPTFQECSTLHQVSWQCGSKNFAAPRQQWYIRHLHVLLPWRHCQWEAIYVTHSVSVTGQTKLQWWTWEACVHQLACLKLAGALASLFGQGMSAWAPLSYPPSVPHLKTRSCSASSSWTPENRALQKALWKLPR